MKTLVKICGIRNVDSAQAAVDAGADFIGLNFVPTSKRRVDILVAQQISKTVKGKVKRVGVFKNQPISDMKQIVESVGLDYIQLHGEEVPDVCSHIHIPVIKAFRLQPEFDVDQVKLAMKLYTISYFLLDRQVQGEGSMLSLEKAKQLGEEFPIFFGGGLTPENVASVVQKVKPSGVDVASGIETDGKEDNQKIIKFVQTAKQD